jgi:phosphoserine phosphatase
VATGAAVVYAAVVAGAFLWADLILDLPRPLFLVGVATAVVAAVGFHEQSKARARLDRELAVARAIQQDTFPKKMPAVDGYEIAGTSVPAEETGGDSFDVIRLGERHVVLLLGDATGHGVGPALSVTQMRSMLRIAMRLGADLDRTLREINDQLAEDLASNRFVTAFLGVLDASAHTLTYHAAGQGPILHYRAAEDALDWHPSTTMPLGMMEQLVAPKAVTLRLAPGDLVGLITDGVYEYVNPADEQFGEERVAAVVRQHRGEPVERMVEALLAGVRQFGKSAPQADDATILVVRRT